MFVSKVSKMMMKKAANLAVNTSISCRNFSSSSKDLLKTAVYPLHLEFGGRMVDFAGWSLPMQYGTDGIISSHLHTRSNASIFDVSHMGQVRLYGADRLNFIEKLVVGDIKGLSLNEARLSLLMNEKGGIKDDTIITNQGNYLNIVINGACRDSDMAHITRYLEEAKAQGMDLSIELLQEQSLIALQGPESMKVLQNLLPDEFKLEKMAFMTGVPTTVDGIKNCIVSRCGYTGEDGFEISVPDSNVEQLIRKLLTFSSVKMAGLGARDTLRLEAGFCLYGHDLNEETTPVEASLMWTVGKRRRAPGEFLGVETVLQQLKDGPTKKRVGITFSSRAVIREGAKLFSQNGEEIGVVTSGTFAPSLQAPIAMGYVKTPFSKIGTKIQAELRGNMKEAEVSKMPFIPAAFYRVP